MLLLLCLFFNAFTYSAENIPLTSVIVEDDYSVIENTKENFLLGKPYWTAEKVHFYDSEKNIIESFKPKSDIMNFNIEDMRLSTILKSPDILSFLQKNGVPQTIPTNTLDMLFYEIERYDGSINGMQKKTIYNFQRFIYAITSYTDVEKQMNSYHDFLVSIKQDVSVHYERTSLSCKPLIIGVNIVTPAVFTSLGYGLFLKNPTMFPFLISTCTIAPLLIVFTTTSFYLQHYLSYKKIVNLMKTLEENTQE